MIMRWPRIGPLASKSDTGAFILPRAPLPSICSLQELVPLLRFFLYPTRAMIVFYFIVCRFRFLLFCFGFFSSMFMKETGLQFLYVTLALSSLDIKVELISEWVGEWSVFFLLFLKVCIRLNSFLKCLQNLCTKTWYFICKIILKC